MKIAIVGPGRSGKDTAAEWLDWGGILKYWGSCSRVICPHAARHLGISEEEAWETRHQHRDLWRKIGDHLRRVNRDDAYLARLTLKHGDVCVGIRARAEMDAVLAEKLVDLVIWIEKPDVEPDDTLEFGDDVADVILKNDGTLGRLYHRLGRLVDFAGLPTRRGEMTRVRFVHTAAPWAFGLGSPGRRPSRK